MSLSIGCGKTFAAIIALMYKLYLLLCMRNPQDYLGLARGTPIVFGLFSATQRLANADEYKTLTSIMSISPFFRKIAGVKDLARPHEFLRLPHNIQIAFGSRAQNVLGMNLYAALLDEAAFSILTGDSQMQNLFDGIYRRLTSRYANSPSLGLLIVSSSRASQSDFVERHLAKWSAQANMVKITRAAIYEVKPFEFPAEAKFQVMVGNEITPSRLLKKDELPTPGFQVIEIPDHYQLRHQYEMISKAPCAISRMSSSPTSRR